MKQPIPVSVTDAELLDLFFTDPDVKYEMMTELGSNGTIFIDWDNRIVTAKGSISGVQWNLDELIKEVRGMLRYEEN